MAEGNSCYNAGKPGVSDTFAAALWAGDYCLQMAVPWLRGCQPACWRERILFADRRLYHRWIFSRPEYYGLRLRNNLPGSHMFTQAKLEAQGANLTAYAAGDERGTKLIAIFNKDARDTDVSLSEERRHIESTHNQAAPGSCRR